MLRFSENPNVTALHRYVVSFCVCLFKYCKSPEPHGQGLSNSSLFMKIVSQAES